MSLLYWGLLQRFVKSRCGYPPNMGWRCCWENCNIIQHSNRTLICALYTDERTHVLSVPIFSPPSTKKKDYPYIYFILSFSAPNPIFSFLRWLGETNGENDSLSDHQREILFRHLLNWRLRGFVEHCPNTKGIQNISLCQSATYYSVIDSLKECQRASELWGWLKVKLKKQVCKRAAAHHIMSSFL